MQLDVRPAVTSGVLIDDDDEARAYWRAAYGPQGQTARLPPNGVLRHETVDAGPFVLCELEIPPGFSYVLEPLGTFVVAHVRAGRIVFGPDSDPRPATAGRLLLTGEPGSPRYGRSEGVSLRLTLVHPALVQRVLGVDDHPSRTPPVRFTDWHPVSDAAAAQWNVTRTFVAGVARGPEEVASRLVLDAAARSLAAALLATFPNTAVLEPQALDRRDAGSESLRRAVAYIESRPADDIGLADIAAAARVSPRAVQLAFRRHLGRTPTSYLRLVRLHHVRDELRAADPQTETVAAVARRWGFAHAGRFSAQYRDAFGESPSRTLRGAGG